LKLEKYASDYREKRLKREMDEIINEFNETAERNINILDNRIETIKTLLKKSEIIDSIDISVRDELEEKPGKKDGSNKRRNTLNEIKKPDNESLLKDNRETEPDFNSDDKLLKEKNNGLLLRFASNIKERFQRNSRPMIHPHENENNTKDGSDDSYSSIQLNINSGIKKSGDQAKEKIDIIVGYPNDHFNIKPENNDETLSASDKNEPEFYLNSHEQEDHNVYNKKQLSENELEDMFSASKDKYLLISELYEKGYPTDLISRSSGIPIGEIKLVVDLNKSL